jgi:hypothetical protein
MEHVGAPGARLRYGKSDVLAADTIPAHRNWISAESLVAAIPEHAGRTEPSSVAPRFEAARTLWEHFHPHADIVALLRARLEQEAIEAQQAAEWCHAQGVRPPIEARWVNWGPDYEECFYRELAARARAVYLFRNEYLFVLDQTVISEIPEAGHASYIFRPNTSLDAFLGSYTQTTRHAIRTEPKTARKRLGYIGRIPHLKDLSAWIARFEGTVANPVTQRATA